MRRGGSRVMVLVAAVFAPACGLISGLDSLERSADPSVVDAGTDASSPSDAQTDTSDSAIAVEAGTDAGVDAAISYVDEVLKDAPIAYYRLDETSGTTVNSAIPGAPDGTFTHNVILGSASPITGAPGNRAATFSATLQDSDLTFGDHFSFAGLAHFTIEAWVKPGAGNGSGPMHIFSKADRVLDSPITGWNICIEQSGTGWVVWLERFASSSAFITPKTPISLGAYTHVVAVYNGSLILYTNGVSHAGPVDARSMVAPTTSAFAGSADGANGHGLVGDLDEIAIYDKGLTFTRINAHYKAGKP